MAINQDELNKILWNAADKTRGHIDASIFKDYILAMLFLKYISDLSKNEYNHWKERFGNDEVKIKNKMENARFYIPEGSSFYYLYEHRNDDDFGVQINKALHKIEDTNIKKLEGIFQSIDFASESVLGRKDKKNPMLIGLFDVFNKIEFDISNEDLIGNSYMYLIEKFGSAAGKKAGEFYTPSNVSLLIAKLGNAKDNSRILDPACGSGGLLLLAGKNANSKSYALYGQESVGTTYNLARMNMFLHNEDSANIYWGDSLRGPGFIKDDKLMQFDLVLANPPFSLADWGYDDLQKDIHNRFEFGMPPKNKGDYAFILHMLASTKDTTGKVVVIVPHGVLFRGSSEGKIRQKLLEENLIDTVIGLPANLFQTTGIPVAILILDKSRQKYGENESRKDILFIDASKEFVPAKAQNYLSEGIVDKIVSVYRKRTEIEKYSHLATFEEVVENDFNLNIPRYVDTFEEEEEVDLDGVRKEIEEVEKELREVEEKMRGAMEELGL